MQRIHPRAWRCPEPTKPQPSLEADPRRTLNESSPSRNRAEATRPGLRRARRDFIYAPGWCSPGSARPDPNLPRKLSKSCVSISLNPLVFVGVAATRSLAFVLRVAFCVLFPRESAPESPSILSLIACHYLCLTRPSPLCPPPFPARTADLTTGPASLARPDASRLGRNVRVMRDSAGRLEASASGWMDGSFRPGRTLDPSR